MILYLDTSAFLKMFLQEEGSDALDRIWEASHEKATSRLTYPEARAGLAYADRAGRLQPGEHSRAKRELARRWAELHVLEVTPSVAETAGQLAEQHALRGSDAVHLASAKTLVEGFVLATWDRALRRAASAMGLGIAPASDAGKMGG